MDSATLGKALVDELRKFGFKNYGTKLFYREFRDCIIILKQENYNMAAELYLQLIIKECHPEITKITKHIIRDKMLIDSSSYDKLLYRSEDGVQGWDYRLDCIDTSEFGAKIAEIFQRYIACFSEGVINGIKQFKKNYPRDGQHTMMLFRDSAIKIGHEEWGIATGHEWFLSDNYILIYKYGVDDRFVNRNTERYIMENVIPHIPPELKGKSVGKWCNERCKEIFLAKGKRFFLGWGLPFPFIDGKPLKYCGPKTDGKGKTTLFYLNEDTNELYAYKQIKVNPKDHSKDVYEITKVK